MPTHFKIRRDKMTPRHPVLQRQKRAGRRAQPHPRAESKGAQILALIGRSKGATLAEIRKTTGWQAHSVRGYLSNAAKKHSLTIESTKTEAGDRVYRLCGAPHK